MNKPDRGGREENKEIKGGCCWGALGVDWWRATHQRVRDENLHNDPGVRDDQGRGKIRQ